MSVFFIAEAGIAHNGDFMRAMEMVRVAKECGADAVKFQSFTPSVLAPEPGEYRVLLDKCWLSDDMHRMLFAQAQYCGIEFMSTPFDNERVDFLVALGVKRIKIGSGQVRDSEFVRHVASKKLPVIMSNGMATQDELEKAVREIPSDMTVLFCVSIYPAPLQLIDFRRMNNLGPIDTAVGFSDHTESGEASIIAAASGATVIERHFTLDKSLPGPDQICSSTPQELKRIITEIRKI